MQSEMTQELLHTAARLVVDEGMEYGPAKKRALKLLGWAGQVALPTNEALEDAVLEHLELFCADTQPRELAALREIALVWMRRLQPHQPLLTGAVWRGTATRLSDIYIDLFADDSKMVEIDLINKGVAFSSQDASDHRGDRIPRLVVHLAVAALQRHVAIHLTLRDPIEQRGSLLADVKGRPMRGHLQAVEKLVVPRQDVAGSVIGTAAGSGAAATEGPAKVSQVWGAA